MKFEAVTTFNREGRDLYGNRMMSSYLKNWPAQVPLTIYTDGFELWLQPGLHETVPWLREFKKRHGHRLYRDFRWDAIRFAHKVAAWTHAAATTHADVLIWLDGDTVTHSEIHESDLEKLAPIGEEWISWLDRDGNYPETGIFMLNCRHEQHLPLVEAMTEMYTEDRLFELAQWHDAWVLDRVVYNAGVRTKSLSGEGRRTSHPVVNGPLSRWLDHAKGNRKQAGRTPSSERVLQDDNPYWKT